MTIEKRLTALEEKFGEWEKAAGSGDPVGAFQRVMVDRKASLIENPETMTNAEIDNVTANDGTDSAENSANKDAAESLKKVNMKPKARK
jgi:hypothetical protein